MPSKYLSLTSVTLMILSVEGEFSFSEFIHFPFTAFLARRELHTVRGRSCSVSSNINVVLRSKRNYFYYYNYYYCRSQWPRGLRPRSAAARLLRLWVRIPPEAWMSVCCECCVLSGRGLCDELITRPEESYRLWCVVVCDL